jgi:RHS repeat-associated protein
MAGDVDRDGFADVLVGAYAYDNPETDEGKVFAWYGGSGGLGPSGTPGNTDWSAEGNQVSARFGLAAGTAGDVNHDQYDDVIVGADRYDSGQTDEGKAFAYLSTRVSPATVRKFYYFGGQRIAMRLNGVLYYLVGDHPSAALRTGLGTTSLVLNAQGNVMSEARHYPYGEERWHTSTLPTDYRFTGQRLDDVGLYQMGARWYDPYTNRFVSPDTIIPDPANPQSFNRYSYVLGNPVRFQDPSGHWTEEELAAALGENWREQYFGKGGIFEGRDALLAFLLSQDTTSAVILDTVGQFFMDAYVAYKAGVDFTGVDALGSRLAVAGSGGFFVAGSVDVVLNLTSGEFSFFGSPEIGMALGGGLQAVMGMTLLKNLPSNQAFRGTFMAVGLVGGDVLGLNVEAFWSSPMSDQFQAFEGAHGEFCGVGPAVELGAYGSISYSWEAYRYDAGGGHWYSPPNPLTVVADTIQAVWHDLVLHPIWPWSPYR